MRGHRVAQPHEREEGRALGWDESVGPALERPAAAGRAQRTQNLESGIDDQPVAAAHRASEHEIRPTVVQPVTCDLDGVQRGGTRRIEGERSALQAQGVRCRVRPHSRAEAGAGVSRAGYFGEGCVQVRVVGKPDPFGVRGQAPARIPEVAEDEPGPLRTRVVSCLAQRGTARVQHPLKRRVVRRDLFGVRGEAFGIEGLREASDEAGRRHSAWA